MKFSAVIVVLALNGAVAACGGGGGTSGPNPKYLSMSGLKIPTSQVVAGVQSMCPIAKQAHTDPAASGVAFYRPDANGNGPHLAMHQLVTILHPSHRKESDAVLNAMYAYESDTAQTPPPAATGTDADALVQAADAGLAAVKVTPPVCA